MAKTSISFKTRSLGDHQEPLAEFATSEYGIFLDKGGQEGDLVGKVGISKEEFPCEIFIPTREIERLNNGEVLCEDNPLVRATVGAIGEITADFRKSNPTAGLSLSLGTSTMECSIATGLMRQTHFYLKQVELRMLTEDRNRPDNGAKIAKNFLVLEWEGKFD